MFTSQCVNFFNGNKSFLPANIRIICMCNIATCMNLFKQAEAEVVPSSSLVDVLVEVEVAVDVEVEVEVRVEVKVWVEVGV